MNTPSSPSSPSSAPSVAVDYKKTLNLPQTDFAMKANAAVREPEIEAVWESTAVYQQAMARRDKKRLFVLHDGPPYLSSDKIHIGTALNKILKDIVTRYQFQQGHYAPYVPGYDGHGLPIENAVVKSLPGGRKSITPAELRKRCRTFALDNLKGQETNFKRLGVWGHWEKPYITIDGRFEATQIRLFYDMFKKGYVYKGLKPVYWSPSSESALAEAEVEYADHQSHSIYVTFKVTGAHAARQAAIPAAIENTDIVIWTTTPWTLPANLALSVHPDFEYVVIATDAHGKLLVAKALLDSFLEKLGNPSYQLVSETPILGKDLEYLLVQHPFIADRQVPVLCGTHVTADAGTGIVHTAPGHGMEDYVICQAYDRQPAFSESPIGILSPIDDKGCFTAEAGERFQGVFYEKGNALVLEALKETQSLLFHETFNHSYPHDWRTHQPVIYRATEQWFISVDKFRQQALDAIKTVKWIPERGETRISSMVEGRADWCISRQRVWGVPIPVFYDADTREMVVTDAVIAHVSKLFDAHTSDIWWEKSAEELLADLDDTAKAEIGYGKRRLVQETDIMDVWFDSGVTHTAVVEDRAEELGHLPVSLYLEGSDQHRGWFQSSLLTSVMLHGKAPYQTVLTHGFVLDDKGRKMSKSLGNVVDPLAVISQYGADVLRLWVASVDYTNDVKIGKESIGQLVEVYKKVRNTLRYLMGNLAGFEPQNALPYEQLSMLDRYTLHRLEEILADITDCFETYQFHRYFQVLQNFCVVDLSQRYFDVAKDTLYTHAADSPTRRGIQTVLYTLLTTLVRMLVPVMPHLAEDVWQNLPDSQKPLFGEKTPLISIVMAPWPKATAAHLNPALAQAMEQLLQVKNRVNLTLEGPRKEGKIGSSLETKVALKPLSAEARGLLAQTSTEELARLFLTSQVVIVEAFPADAPVLSEGVSEAGEQTLQVAVAAYPAEGEKCPRCWKFEPSVGASPLHPTLCAPCVECVAAVDSASVT